jgi:isoleucyl-tRNA synthetase
MSKSRGNVVDPWELLHSYGADATRWYMYASAPPYNPRRFAPEHVGEVQRQFILTLWNTFSFFTTYANIDGWRPKRPLDTPSQAIDRWALARLNALVRDVSSMLDNYDIHGPAKAIEQFVEELSNWYVRRNRRRFWKSEDDSDKQAAYQTLYTCLTTLAQLLAPFMPYLSERLYRTLVAEIDAAAPESVHLAGWPSTRADLIDEQLLADTAVLLDVVSLGRAARQRASLRVRQPLSELLVRVPGNPAAIQRFDAELRDELNVKQIRLLSLDDRLVEYRFKPNLPVVGRKYGKLVPALREALAELRDEQASDLAQAIEAGQARDLQVDGQTISLQPDEVIVEATSPAGFEVAEAGGVLVALNTEVSPDLRLEGQARDLVRAVQDARRAAGLALTDRIDLRVASSDGLDLDALLASHGRYVADETLACSLEIGQMKSPEYQGAAELDAGAVVISLKRAQA